MSVSDPVADFLTCIRNAIGAKHRKLDVPSSRMKQELAKVLLRERFINNFKLIENGRQGTLRVYLKYSNSDEAAISNLERVSKPGCRVYVRRDEIPRVLGGMGINILTTPRGVMTGRQARREGVGGEVLCQVW